MASEKPRAELHHYPKQALTAVCSNKRAAERGSEKDEGMSLPKIS